MRANFSCTYNTGYVQIKGNTVNNNGVIKQQLTIPSGVTLNLPYAAFKLTWTTTADDGTVTEHVIDIPAGVNDVAADGTITAQLYNMKNPMGADAVATEDYCTTKVVLCENVELVVLGDLMIAGQLDGGNATRKYSGQTSGYHARLVLEKGSKVTVYGEMHVPGFIVDGKTGAGTVTVENGGTLYQPMVIRDFKGGSFTAQVYAQIIEYKASSGLSGGYVEIGAPISPFNEIAFMNVESKVTVKYGGNVKNYGNLHANSAVNSTIGHLIGSNSAAFIQLDENAYMEFDYDPSTNIIDLHMYGGASTNSFEISIFFNGETLSCSSNDFIFPISWMYNITLDVIGSGSATYNMSSRFKLMPGSKMTVASGATLNIDELYVYDTSYSDGNTVSTKYPENYSERDTTLTGALPNAELIVNGTLSADVLSGNVWSTNPNGAHVTATTASSSVKEASGNGSSNTSYTFTLKFLFGNNTAETPNNKNVDYSTSNSKWSGTSSSGGGGCVTPETLVTLADGSQVMVKDLIGNELLLVWNHYTGKIDVAPVLDIIDHNGIVSDVIVTTLYFSDGSYLEMIGEHVFFDVDLNEYVTIAQSNWSDFVNHTFIKLNGESLEYITLINASDEIRTTTTYGILSSVHFNCFTNGILTSSTYTDRFLNAFEFEADNMMYSEDIMQNDIDTYGLYTYEEFEGMITEDVFNAFHFDILKISVSKGIITWDEIVNICSLMNRFNVNVEN